MITSIAYVFYGFLDWVGDLEVEVIQRVRWVISRISKFRGVKFNGGVNESEVGERVFGNVEVVSVYAQRDEVFLD